MTGKQKGSTLLGLVMGSLIGLGLAFAVALYITKVPVPLTAKAPQHSAESDAAEIQKNKGWDPNAPLAGKGPVRPYPVASGDIASGAQPSSVPSAPVARLPDLAATKVVPKEEPKEEPKEVPKEVPKVVIAAAPVPAKVSKARSADSGDDELGQFIAAVPAKPVKPAPSPIPATGAATAIPPVPVKPVKPAATAIPAPGEGTAIPPVPATTAIPPVGAVAKPGKSAAIDPISDLARNRSADIGASAPDPFTYFLQAGAFRSPEEAEKQRTRLQSLGMASRVTEREQAGRMVYRVRVGPFDKKDEADKVKSKMEGQSLDAALVRVQR
jgi:cell division protein FtsN